MTLHHNNLRDIAKAVVTSVVMTVGMGAWAAFVPAMLGLLESTGTIPGRGAIYFVLASASLIAGFVVTMVVWFVVEELLDVYPEDFTQFWVVIIGVVQYGLSVVGAIAEMDRWWLWMAAAAWAALAAVTTPLLCAFEIRGFRRYAHYREAQDRQSE